MHPVRVSSLDSIQAIAEGGKGLSIRNPNRVVCERPSNAWRRIFFGNPHGTLPDVQYVQLNELRSAVRLPNKL